MTKARIMELIRNWALMMDHDIDDEHIEMLAGLLAEEGKKEFQGR